MTRRATTHIVIAVAYSAATLVAGQAALGFLAMLVFTAGFFGGLLLWLVLPSRATWPALRLPFWTTMALFVLHRIEEKVCGFFAMLSRVTGVPTPEVASPAVIAMVVLSVGGWLAVPLLLRRGHPLGHYFAWTFFASMGLTELAHWVLFPFLQGPGFAMTPGMWSVLVLAPTAWWGMVRLVRGST